MFFPIGRRERGDKRRGIPTAAAIGATTLPKMTPKSFSICGAQISRSAAECCESRLGRRLVRIVPDAEERGLETLHEAIDMLGMRLDDFDKAAAPAGGRPEPGAAA